MLDVDNSLAVSKVVLSMSYITTSIRWLLYGKMLCGKLLRNQYTSWNPRLLTEPCLHVMDQIVPICKPIVK